LGLWRPLEAFQTYMLVMLFLRISYKVEDLVGKLGFLLV